MTTIQRSACFVLLAACGGTPGASLGTSKSAETDSTFRTESIDFDPVGQAQYALHLCQKEFWYAKIFRILGQRESSNPDLYVWTWACVGATHLEIFTEYSEMDIGQNPGGEFFKIGDSFSVGGYYEGRVDPPNGDFAPRDVAQYIRTLGPDHSIRTLSTTDGLEWWVTLDDDSEHVVSAASPVHG